MQLINLTNIYVQTKANVIRPSADGQQLTDDLPPKPPAAADGLVWHVSSDRPCDERDAFRSQPGHACRINAQDLAALRRGQEGTCRLQILRSKPLRSFM